MMTSVVSNPARGTRDRALPTTTQTTQPQKQIQATAEQIRLAQMIYDKNDADFEDKVKQLIEVTGKTQDECMVALHDCNEDVNRAINFLLESTSDTTSWETVGKKARGPMKEGGPSETKDNREKRDREASRGRGGLNRRGRGTSRSREVRSEENVFEMGPGDRGADRGRRGRGVAGRGSGGRGRGRAAGGNRFSSQGMGLFNPADYNANSGGSRQETWETEGIDDGTGGTWRGTLEDWAAEDWNEDLSETKVFTASANHITPGHNVDLGLLLPKTGGVEAELGGMEPPAAEGLGGQSLVFTNSHHNGTRTATHSYASAAANSYAPASLSSVLGSGFGALSGPKPAPDEVRIPEQLNGPRLAPRPNQQLVTAGNGSVAKESGPPAVEVPSPISASEFKAPRVEHGPVPTSQLKTHAVDLKMQPEPSPVLSKLAQRQQQAQQSSLPQAEPLSLPPSVPTPPGHGHYNARPPPPRDEPSPGVKLALDHQAPMAEPQQRQIKTQRRRVPPPSKIPSSAVEMPGSADVSGLNVQFGALDFGSEPSVTDMGQQAESTREPASTAVPQPQSSLFSKPGPVSEPLGSLPSMPPVSDPSFPSPSLGLPSATPSPSLGLPSAAPPSSNPSASRVDSGTPRSMPSHLGYSQSKDAPSTPLTNGYCGMRTPGPQDSTSLASRTQKPESPPMSSESGPVHHVPSPAPMPSHSAPLPSLNSHVTSTYSSGSALSTSSSLTMTSEENSSLHAFSSSGPSINAAVSSSNGMMHGPGGLGLTGNAALSAAGRTAQPLLTTTSGESRRTLPSHIGKPPPNLAQGVPPLLANQYIMGPGGLLPAYPQIYGYEDLQMLQSRLPMDYYGVPFPGTTATMPGRDGLANNPYSGEATKFGRGDSSSPAPPSSLSQGPSQPPQAQSQGQGQQTQNQAFLNPPLPPGYGYTGLPYYAGMPGVPSAFQYGPTVFVPPASAKQPNMGLGNPSSQYHQQHQPSYGQHTYGTAPGLSGSGSSGGVLKWGLQCTARHRLLISRASTREPPSSACRLPWGAQAPEPGGALVTPQPPSSTSCLPPAAHSQMLHHHLAQDGQGGPGQRNQSSSMQQKSQGNKSSYGSPYWAN
ncbi:ubiquitin-associated protein 2 [Salvelinus sp. IW2-2015]|uniref:ubiquitin-associated protein 2 n=1 Tax=Salvelinus sp. IW2-2015 TaxID=2691554 RepID=UPI000CDFA3A1|nr:ubiquitin-associated protein 2 isoform X1 [Salvelinus alpinus]